MLALELILQTMPLPCNSSIDRKCKILTKYLLMMCGIHCKFIS